MCRKYSSENQGNSLAQESTSGSVSIASFVVSMDNTALGLVEKWKNFHEAVRYYQDRKEILALAQAILWHMDSQGQLLLQSCAGTGDPIMIGY